MTTQSPKLDHTDLDVAKRRWWAMTPAQRIAEMRTGHASLKLLTHWVSQRPHECPLLNGEWEFLALCTPEVAEQSAGAGVRSGR